MSIAVVVVLALAVIGGAVLAGCQSSGGSKPMAMSDQAVVDESACCVDQTAKGSTADVKHMSQVSSGGKSEWEYNNFGPIDLDRIDQGSAPR